ncbi:MAG: formate C-acetyltransferase/glycerol dehydratase family glycyl radical enzyme [Oscillospiraceae bacterium]
MSELSVPNYIEPTERVLRIKEAFLAAVPEMCCERALIYTEVYRSNASLPLIELRARALRRTLEDMPVFILDGEVIVGHPASRFRSAEVFPDVNIAIMDEIDQFGTREYNRLKVSPEVREKLLGIMPFWKGRTPHDLLSAQRSSAVKDAFACGLLSNPHEWSGFAHVAMDYRKILHSGIIGLMDTIRLYSEKLPESDPACEEKRSFYRAELDICEGVLAFARRYRNLALQKAADETDPERRAELVQMAEVLKRVPALPASSFHEALQAVWFLQLIPQIESNGFSISPGRFDQYCCEYLISDLKSGAITLEQAQELLDIFWLKFPEILRADSRGAAEVNAGYAVGQNLSVGGVDADGRDCTNLLSYLCLQSNYHIRLNQPNFTVRLHRDTPQDFLEKVVESISGGNGMPQLLNDECIIPSLVEHGISLTEARDYIAVGCDEITVHRHWARCNGGYINLAKILELSIGNGSDLKYGVPLFVKDTQEPQSFEQFMERFRRYLRDGIHLQIEEADLTDRIHQEILPLPFISLFLDDCLSRGKDCTDSGAHYNTTGLVAVGTATAADSLYAIQTLVYEDKKLALNEFCEILKSNFKDNEYLRQFILNRLPKFGNDVDEVDMLAADITNCFAEELSRFKNSRGGDFWPALYSVSAQVGLGNVCCATPDGRQDGLPVSDGLTPMYGMDRNGPTAVLASLAKLNHKKYPNGIIVNQRLIGTLFSTENGRYKMTQLLRAFVAHGCFHWQFNIVDNDVLLAAQRDPDSYRGLVVRVAGYSAIFVELSVKAQNSIIERNAVSL